MTYKGVPKRLRADFSTETLQARREWQDMLKVMKGKKTNKQTNKQTKNLQPRLLYPARSSFKHGEIRSFTDKQKQRIQYHQTRSSINAKGSSLDRKPEKVYKLEPKTTK